MKKVLSVILCLVIVCSITSFSSIANAKSKSLYSNKSKITIQKTGSITITSTLGGALTFKVANSSICTAKWGKWNGNKIKLKISGKSYGKTTVTVRNKKTKVSLKIKVTVKTVDIKLPKTPFYIRNYDWDGDLDEEVKVTKVWVKVEYHSYGIEPSVYLYARGKKTYSDEGARVSSMVYIPWKVYKGNIVKDSGDMLTQSIAVGEGFENYDFIDLMPGKYKIKFLDQRY